MQSYRQNKEKVQNFKISYFLINVSQLSKSWSFVTKLAKWQHWSKRKIVIFELQYFENSMIKKFKFDENAF